MQLPWDMPCWPPNTGHKPHPTAPTNFPAASPEHSASTPQEHVVPRRLPSKVVQLRWCFTGQASGHKRTNWADRDPPFLSRFLEYVVYDSLPSPVLNWQRIIGNAALVVWSLAPRCRGVCSGAGRDGGSAAQHGGEPRAEFGHGGLDSVSVPSLLLMHANLSDMWYATINLMKGCGWRAAQVRVRRTESRRSLHWG